VGNAVYKCILTVCAKRKRGMQQRRQGAAKRVRKGMRAYARIIVIEKVKAARKVQGVVSISIINHKYIIKEHTSSS